MIRCLAACVLAMALVGCGDSPSTGSSFSGDISMRLPMAENVGGNYSLVVTIHNTGAPLPNAVLDFGGIQGAYNIDTITADQGVSPNQVVPGTYSLGTISSGETVQVTLSVSPLGAGSQTLYADIYANVDHSTGLGRADEQVGSEASASADVNP